jgi:hypothetical protein
MPLESMQLGKPQLERWPLPHWELRLKPAGRINAPDGRAEARLKSDLPPVRAPRHRLLDLPGFPRAENQMPHAVTNRGLVAYKKGIPGQPKRYLVPDLMSVRENSNIFVLRGSCGERSRTTSHDIEPAISVSAFAPENLKQS